MVRSSEGSGIRVITDSTVYYIVTSYEIFEQNMMFLQGSPSLIAIRTLSHFDTEAGVILTHK